jgi:membrane protein DedA with SNARE-associated domain
MNGGVAGLSGSLALVLLLPMEAGVPIPVPADLVMFTVGERVAAGKFPLWLAVAGFEVIAVLGTTALFLACRGPAQRIIARFGPRLGFTEARLRRAAVFAETRGRPGLALGRATPGLRGLTVIAAAVSGLNGRRALPALILGSSVFLQLHLVLGMLFGPLADRAFDRAKGPALVAAAVLVIGTVVFWRVRRRRRATAPGAWMEATCPACIGVSLLAGRVPGVARLAAPDPVRPPSRRLEGGQQVEEPAGNVDVSHTPTLSGPRPDVPHPGDVL